jgi:hypothetical protein
MEFSRIQEEWVITTQSRFYPDQMLPPLFKQAGGGSFKERQRAKNLIIGYGMASFEYLVIARKSSDKEIAEFATDALDLLYQCSECHGDGICRICCNARARVSAKPVSQQSEYDLDIIGQCKCQWPQRCMKCGGTGDMRRAYMWWLNKDDTEHFGIADRDAFPYVNREKKPPEEKP